MNIHIDGDDVSVHMTRIEACRLGIAIDAGYETVSQAEYYIRTGLSEPVLKQIADVLKGKGTFRSSVSIELEAGVEEVENPRRPRSR